MRFESGLIVPLEEHLFDNDSIRYDGVGAWARLEHRETGKYLQLGTKGFFCVLLWSKPGIPEFLCIEPWQGYPGPEKVLDQRPGATRRTAGVATGGNGGAITGNHDLFDFVLNIIVALLP